MLVNPNVLIGVADAGDHVGLIMDSSQCTYVLGTGCEIPDCSTSAGRCTSSLEGAELSVWPIAAWWLRATSQTLTSSTARASSYRAPDMLSDLPLGRTLPATSPRLRLHPRQGQVLIDHDKLTEARSGQLVLPPEITCSPRCTSHAARALRALSLAAEG